MFIRYSTSDILNPPNDESWASCCNNSWISWHLYDHYWLLVLRGLDSSHYQTCDHWEVWQRSRQNDSCCGHLHRNLLAPCRGVGNGPSRLIQDWLGDEAVLLVGRIESSPCTYPFIHNMYTGLVQTATHFLNGSQKMWWNSLRQRSEKVFLLLNYCNSNVIDQFF